MQFFFFFCNFFLRQFTLRITVATIILCDLIYAVTRITNVHPSLTRPIHNMTLIKLECDLYIFFELQKQNSSWEMTGAMSVPFFF